MDIKKKINDNSPEILISLGLAGMLTSTILAVKATPKVYEMIEKEKEIRHLEGEPELMKMDIVKMGWKPYVPAALGYCISAGCIIGANKVNTKRNVVLATACKVSERALTEYRDKVVEVIGEEKEKEIRGKIAEDRINKDNGKSAEVIITGKGDTLCYDMVSGRYFKSDIDKINKVLNDLNYRLMQENCICLNELYLDLGMTGTDIGNDLGWNIENGLIEVSYSSIISEDGQPCIVMNFERAPEHGFDRIG